ncbi:NAD(P)-binding protein [Qingshengfaniella alkalisoli]|nr:NAD(P)-binding protein [Qingshengfaniella alkalisoli]
MQEISPRKIAIIGGGVGAITAAYALTSAPDWQDRFDIAVYQLGWRLGGKGASGRNRSRGDRIEEHGLHIWAGFYDNAFRYMRDCYEQLVAMDLRKSDDPLGTWQNAFKPLNHFFLSEHVPTASEAWRPWRIDFFGNDAIPGDGGVLPSPFAMCQMLLEFLHDSLERVSGKTTSAAGNPPPLHAVVSHARSMPRNAHRHSLFQHNRLLELLAALRDWLDTNPGDDWIEDDETRRVYYMLDLGAAFIKGMTEDGVFTRGFDCIDDCECSDWLLRHGASRQAVNSVVFRGCYDYVFGYPGGMTDHRGVGAGTAMRGLMRLAFTYKGALFYKMQAGMGDTVFAPYYQVLRARGVKFRFFHAATHLGLSADQDHIETIEMVRQADLRTGDYEPLYSVKHLPCWPSEPDWDQLENGAELKAQGVDFECEASPPTGHRLTLHRGEDFDEVILGASLGSLPYMTKELCAASNRWQRMLDNVHTVATHAAQFWMTEPATETGWPALVTAHNANITQDPAQWQTLMTGFAEPLDTWADMSDLLMRENWPQPGPKSIAYFCSPAHDAADGGKDIKAQTRAWCDTHLTQIWPDTADAAGKFSLDTLYAEDGAQGEARFDQQYFRTNLYGSERYVLSTPGSVKYRMAPDNSGFDNLMLAGDWTLCGINAGCVEAATISGLAAARALTGSKEPIYGEGDLAASDQPDTPALLSSQFAQTAPWPITPAYLLGAMDGIFCFQALPDDEVRALLPAGLELGPQSITPDGTHPVTFLFNRQVGVRPSFMPKLLGFPSYHESIVAVSHLRRSGGDETLFSHLPALYLDDRLATLAGRAFYGMAKRPANVTMLNDRYTVRDDHNRLIWKAEYAQRDAPTRLADLADFNVIRDLLEQPLLMKRGPEFQAAAFDFGLSAAFATPVSASVQIGPANGVGLATASYHSPALGQDNTGRLPGAFRCWTNWTLSNPLDSTRVKRVAALQQGARL